jgi:hypothetical protein
MAYRVSQGFAALIIALSFFLTPLPPDAPILFPLALTLAAILLLAFIVRVLAGDNAGAISLILLSLYPGFSSSLNGALALFCLSALIVLLGTRNYMADRQHAIALCLALAVPIALGVHMSLCLLPLSAAIAFAYLVLRYVPPDSIRPYRALLDRLRANRSQVKWELLIITVAGLFSLLPLLLPSTTRMHSAVHFATGDPTGYLLAVARLLFKFLCAGLDIDTLPSLLTPPLLVASSVTVWWLSVSIQSGNGVPLLLTAIPVAYLVSGSLALDSNPSYARAVHPIFLANLVIFLGLWLRGRANKRVLDSTRD